MKRSFYVVVADNDLYNASSLSNYLKDKNDLEVSGITNDGTQLLDLVECYNPDVVVMDILLSKQDGLSIIKQIRSNVNLNKQPIIIVHTSMNASKAINAVMNAGADYLIEKPQSPESIYSIIESLIDRQEDSISIHEYGQLQSNLEGVVTEYLHTLGVPANVRGYRYLRTAIIMGIEDMENVNLMTKVIYPEVAKKYKSTSSRVERAIRHSIESAWSRGKPECINSIFGNTVRNSKPSNSEFIATISDKIRLQLK